MSVEEMKNMRVIGPKYLLDRVLHETILQGSMHMVDALPRINSTDFFLPLTEKNIEAIEEKSYLKPYSSPRDFTDEERIVKSLYRLFDIKPDLNPEFLTEEYDYNNFMKQFSDINKTVSSTMNEIEIRLQEINREKEYINNLKYLSKLNLAIDHLENMQFLVFRLIKINKENYDKLKKNYENIPAVILKLAAEGKNVILLSSTLETMEETLERILSSVNYTILPLPSGLKGSVEEVSSQLAKDITQNQKLIESLKKSIEGYKEQYSSELRKIFSRLEMKKKIETAKSEIALGNKLFFMCGFVPESSAAQLVEKLEKKFGDKLTILVDEVKNTYSGTTPPTKLNNIKLFKPFESLVKMYGIPSYQEKDPTVFFGLTYMIIFGAMFGDVGQGLILLLSGLFLEYIYKKIDIGGILNRLGLSAIIFGFLYGSVFGSENILPALVMRPMANINSLLIYAVIFGVVIISISYIYSIINAKNDKEYRRRAVWGKRIGGIYLLSLIIVHHISRFHQT